jgi:hypothetical protein
MKKYLIFLILILGCTSDTPENLISEQKMESIIFDIMILNASYNYDLKIDNNLLSDELIYKKYDIDSLQFYESELYYSRNPKIHYNIYSNVKKRILKSIDSLKIIK